MAFARTSVIVPALAVLAGLFGAYKLWSTISKQSTNKTLIIDENEDVEAEVVVEHIVEETNTENLENLEGFKDECASPCSAGSSLHPPSLYTPANSSPSSSACSASSLALWLTNFCDEKEEKIQEVISSKGSTFAPGSLNNPAGSSKSSDGEPTSALLTVNEVQENSICSISEISGLTISDSSGISLSQELTNELKMEIENMKNQLSIYSESFIGLQMGRELGGGTFGTVYEANTRFQKLAVKVLTSKESSTLPASADYMSMHDFYAEALVLANLNHPNILTFEFIISEVSPYDLPGMATELMSDNLYHFIRRAGLKTWNDVWSIANQVANGLKYLHRQKIVHFDIKSSNILLNYSGSPVPNMFLCKVAEFGLAMKNSSGAIGIYSQRGTTHYMAPEVIRTSHHGMQSVTEKVDVYSFGILLWELIMGELPYNGMRDDQIESFVLNGRRPNVPNWCDICWKRLMKACWNKDEDQRPNFDQIVDHLSCLRGAP